MSNNDFSAPYCVGECSLANRFVSIIDILPCLSHNMELFLKTPFRGYFVNPGLLIVEGGQFTNQKGGIRTERTISLRGNIADWKSVVSSVSKLQRSLFVNLKHAGRSLNISSIDKEYATYHFSSHHLSESLEPQQRESRVLMPHEMSALDIELIKAEIFSAVKMLSSVGVDGVELDCTSGSILSQFLSPQTNLRRDMYGGSFVNRARFLDHIIEMISKIMDTKRVSVRMSDEVFADIMEQGGEIDMCKHMAEQFNKFKIAFLHIQMHQNHRGCENLACFAKEFDGSLLLSEIGGENSAIDEEQMEYANLIGLRYNSEYHNYSQNRQFYDWTINNSAAVKYSDLQTKPTRASIPNYGAFY